MARKTKFSKEEILKKSIEFIKEFGYFKLTVRDLTKYIGCSTQPIFKNFNNFEEYKDNLKLYLRDDYNSFIKQYIDEEDYLYTISYAYALVDDIVPESGESNVKVIVDANVQEYWPEELIEKYSTDENTKDDLWIIHTIYKRMILELFIGYEWY